MTQEQPKPEKQKTCTKKSCCKRPSLVVSILVAILILWASATKAGYIPNFLNINALEQEEKRCIEGIDSEGNCLHEFFVPHGDTPVIKKPIIYLYPEQTTDVLVQLQYDGDLFATYPDYDETIQGWSVTAQPDGTLTNHTDGDQYSYLFWEGYPKTPINWDLSTGFVVKGSDTKSFLKQKLGAMGLTPKEYNEFIVYWFPLMQDNEYNLIHFAEEQYTDLAPLNITPAPDSMLRVFMVTKPLTEKIEIAPQTIHPFDRTGFSVIEWGGTQLSQ